MSVQVPIDGSDCSIRAIEFAAEFADRYDTGLHVVHFTDSKTSDVEELMDRVRDRLADLGVRDEPEVRTESRLFRAEDKIGEDVLDPVEEEGYDHVVMGHHGTGAAGRAVLGSASRTVIDGAEVPVTLVR